MLTYKIQYREDQQVMHALRLFSTIPYNLLEEFLRKKNNVPFFEPKECLKRMLVEKYIYYSAKDKCYRAIDRYPKQINKICSFATYLHFCRNDEEKIELARYPFDYIFEDNKKLFQLIDFAKDGVYKLRFRKEMEQQGESTEVIPIIMLINSNLDVLKEMDQHGNYTLIPKQDYQVAFVSYAPGDGEADTVAVTSKRFRGGTFIEY